MDQQKSLDEQYREVEGKGGFYTPAWRSQQGDETDQALHRRAIERREQALAGGVDGGSGRLREGDAKGNGVPAQPILTARRG